MTETDETDTDTKPVCVNPNFSNRIMGRASDMIFSFLISAVVGEGRRAVRRRSTAATARGVFVISSCRSLVKVCLLELDKFHSCYLNDG